MNNLEKLFRLGIASFGLYTAGNAFVNQLKKVERDGPDSLSLLVLAGMGVAFFNRLDSIAIEAKKLSGS